jgi:hypothetical protein
VSTRDDQRFFFVHLQKTAGTTLRRRLRNHFGEAAIYPNESDGTDIPKLVLSIEYLQERLHVRRHEIRVVSGHFPYCVTELLGGGFTTLTVLREPVDRMLSYLRHHRQQTPADRHKTLEEIYDDPFRFHGLAHNHMVKMFSLTPEEMTAGMLTHVEFTDEHLERAKGNLARVNALGLQDRFDEFCYELTARFGWQLGEQEVTNQTRPSDVPDEFIARIVEENALDVALYEYGCQLYDQRRANATSRSHA